MTNEKIKTKMAALFKEKREKSDKPQEKFAREIHCSLRNWQRKERDGTDSIKEFLELAELLDIDVKKFFEEIFND